MTPNFSTRQTDTQCEGKYTWYLCLFVFLTSLRVFAVEVPAEDPAREWLGKEYADTIFTTFKARHPDIPLKIDAASIGRLEHADQRMKWSLRSAAKGFRENWEGASKDDQWKWTAREKLVEGVQGALPQEISRLARDLEHGEKIELKANDATIENQLREWLKSQADGSVAPHEFMIEALRLSQGRVVTAWASAWNLTVENFMLASTRNYHELRAKFVSLTGEKHLWKGAAQYVVLPPDGWETVNSRAVVNGESKVLTSEKRMKLLVTKRGDDFSYLYHRIGVELFAMATAEVTGSPLVGRILGSAGAMGEFLKYPLTAGLATENRKRVHNDLMGSVSGSHFFKLVHGLARPRTDATANALTYLRPNAKKYGTSYQITDGRPAEYYGSKLDAKYWDKAMSVEELKIRFYHATRVDKVAMHGIILGTTGDAERLHQGLIQYSRAGAPDEELNQLLRNFARGDTAHLEKKDVDVDLNLRHSDNETFLEGLVNNFEFQEYHRRLSAQVTRVLAIANSPNRRTQSSVRCEVLLGGSHF